MYNLSDRERELMLWFLCGGMGIRETARESRHSKKTPTYFIQNFHFIATMGGWKVAPQFADLDQFKTILRLPLNGKLRKPIEAPTDLPLLTTRAIVATAREGGLGQRLIDDVFPIIRATYWPNKRRMMLEMEARQEGSLAPPQCHHCGGTYGWKRHEEICVRFGLA